MCWFERHVKLVTDGNTKKAVAPKELTSNISQIVPSFIPGRQEDAHEFLRHFTDKMQKDSKPKAVGQAGVLKPQSFLSCL
jgi:ubiquitin carboxyl-terminal hydrolase 36/42